MVEEKYVMIVREPLEFEKPDVNYPHGCEICYDQGKKEVPIDTHKKCIACGILVGPGHLEQYLSTYRGYEICGGCIAHWKGKEKHLGRGVSLRELRGMDTNTLQEPDEMPENVYPNGTVAPAKPKTKRGRKSNLELEYLKFLGAGGTIHSRNGRKKNKHGRQTGETGSIK